MGGGAVAVSDKANFRTRRVVTDEEVCCIMTMESFLWEDLTILTKE